MPSLAKKISLAIGLMVCASMSHAGNCGAGYVLTVGVGAYNNSTDVYFKMKPSIDEITTGKWFDGALPHPLMRLRPQTTTVGLTKLGRQTVLLQMALAGKLPVMLHSDANDCKMVDSVTVLANETSYHQ